MVEHGLDGVDEVVDPQERAHLVAVAVDRQRLPPADGVEEVGDDAAIAGQRRIHARAVDVEDPQAGRVEAPFSAGDDDLFAEPLGGRVAAPAAVAVIDEGVVLAERARVAGSEPVDLAARREEEPRPAAGRELDQALGAADVGGDHARAIREARRGGRGGQVDDRVGGLEGVEGRGANVRLDDSAPRPGCLGEARAVIVDDVEARAPGEEPACECPAKETVAAGDQNSRAGHLRRYFPLTSARKRASCGFSGFRSTS